MEITTRTPDRLVIRQSAWVGRAMGAAFALMGAAAIVFFSHAPAAQVHGPVFVAYAVGGMFILVGLGLVALTRNERVEFDRTAGVVHITSGRKTTDYPLAEIAGVALEESPGADMSRAGGGQLFYRPMLVLTDGRHIPWTATATGDARRPGACVAAARAFGKWAALPTDTAHVPAPAPVQVVRAQGANYAGAYAMLGLFTLAACAMAYVDVLRLATWQPVPATVMGSTIDVIHGNRGGVSYRPAVTYWYSRNGTSTVATGVTPMRFGAGYKWAMGISQQFRPGAHVTAYVDPHNPTRAFLVHRFDLLPAVFLGIVTLLWVLVLWGRPRTGQGLPSAEDLGVQVLARSMSPLR
jgi:hypothetical protein